MVSQELIVLRDLVLSVRDDSTLESMVWLVLVSSKGLLNFAIILKIRIIKPFWISRVFDLFSK